MRRLLVLLAAMLAAVFAVAGPAAAQATRGYVLGADDAVIVSVYGQPEAGTTQRIKADGTIVVPLIGKLQAAGETVLSLAATTGLRRGELAGLRRDRIDFDGSRLRVDTAVNDAGGTVVIKSTKTHQARWLAIDNATLMMLARHLLAMDERAKTCGLSIADDAFVFSLELDCSAPMRPEFMTRHIRALRTNLGLTNESFDASILALRKFTTTELMDAGFNPSAVSGRQGHTVQVMLAHYSKRRRSADVAAADHLGGVVFGRP